VCELAAQYREVYEALLEAISDLSTTEREQVLGATAARFYALELLP
jgi:predicted TIM-barrel fold metal-dependent hydrolase